MNRPHHRPAAFAAALVLALAFTAPPSARANLLVNPGFEDPISTDGVPFVGNWDAIDSGPGSVTNSTDMPHSGAQHLALEIDDFDNQFALAIQDVEGLTAGDSVLFSLFVKTPTATIGPEVRIEWRSATTEISRTPNLVPTVTGNYTLVELPSVVPAGADVARLVIAIQTFGPGSNTSVLYVDDTSFVVVSSVPTPAALPAGLAALLALAARRHRHR